MKFVGAHIFDYDATFRGSVNIGSATSPAKKLTVTTSATNDGILGITTDGEEFFKAINSNSTTFPVGQISLYYGSTVTSNITSLSNEMRLSGGFTTGGKIVFRTASTERMRLTDNGLGIGLTSPSRKLEVASTSSYVATLNSTQNNSFISFVDANTSSDTFVAIGSETGDLIFRAGNTERARINTDGKFGIGTSSPNMPLSIESSDDFLAFFKSTDNKGFIGIADNDTTGYISAENDTMSFGAATGVNANNLNINLSNNNVGIGTSSIGSAYKLDVNGKVKARGVLELDDVLTLNAISTPADPGTNQSSIYMDSADGAIRVKINVGGTTVTRTLATFE